MNFNEKKGLSLIVIIITIIVVIVIASAIILNIDDTKIVNKTEKTVKENNIATAKEIRTVAKTEWRVNGKRFRKEGYTSFDDYLDSKMAEAGLDKEMQFGSDGTVYLYPKIPKGFVASEADGETRIATGLVIYETKTPVTDKNVVDAQKAYNQYVWVPVNDISEFERIEWKAGVTLDTTSSYKLGDAAEEKEYNAMKKSVEKYGGFYIGRYEAGKEEGDNLVVKRNATVWNEVGWHDVREQCKTLSTNFVVGHLIYGEEWDAALKFILKTDDEYVSDSKIKGNYSGNILSTGPSDDYARNNIYDMAGNVQEWTSELRETYHRVIRGGYYPFSVANRNYAGPNDTSVNCRFSSSFIFKIKA